MTNDEIDIQRIIFAFEKVLRYHAGCNCWGGQEARARDAYETAVKAWEHTLADELVRMHPDSLPHVLQHRDEELARLKAQLDWHDTHPAFDPENHDYGCYWDELNRLRTLTARPPVASALRSE